MEALSLLTLRTIQERSAMVQEINSREEASQPPLDSVKQNSSENTGHTSTKSLRRVRRGALHFASLNIKGGGSTTIRNKWLEMNQIMKTNKIDVLAI